MRRVRGFTLIELMIVLAVIAILLAIAVPAFTDQLRKSRRSDAMRGLADLQLREERWRASHSTYAATATVGFGGLPPSDFYDFAITANSATDAAMTATPKGAQLGDRCGTYALRIDNNNDDNPNGRLDRTTSTGLANCW